MIFLINELGLDGVLDYKCTTVVDGNESLPSSLSSSLSSSSTTSLEEQIDVVCPESVDFIYDIVDGSTTFDTFLWTVQTERIAS